MTLLALVVAVTAGAQGTAIHEYPWNPDWDNDNFVGTSDLTGFLSAFEGEFGNPPEPCDYDGTPLEVLAVGIADGSIILDSLFVEYELEDVATYFMLGCPDLVTDTLIFANSMMLKSFNNNANYWHCYGFDSYSYYSTFRFQWDTADGLYKWRWESHALDDLGFSLDGFFGGSQTAITNWAAIPFPESWYLDEDGIHIDSEWDQNDWPYYANYLHILPYWHYAE